MHRDQQSPTVSEYILSDTVALFNCTAIATFINWKINDTPVDQFTSKQFQEQASVVLNACNTGFDIRDTESFGITGKQQHSVCSCTRGIIKHVQWCLPCNNACIEKLRTVISVLHQCLISMQMYLKCTRNVKEATMNTIIKCACGIAFFSMCLLVCMKYVRICTCALSL